MSVDSDTDAFVAWEEHIISQEKGNRVVHFYLKDASGNLVLAVVGTERSIRHMIYVVSDEFLQAYEFKGSITACTKWRARREVVDWLKSLVSEEHRPSLDISSSLTSDSAQALRSHEMSVAGFSAIRTHLPDRMIQVPRKFKVQHSDIVWSGVAWVCCKQLKHYPAFCRNETTIAVHSFVFIMAEEESHYLGYLEDLYEDKKGQKKVKVRWFHHNKEVKGVIPQLNPHPKEVFITPHVQAISAECIDGPATVLTPKHYDKCLAVAPQTLSSAIHMCSRQFKNNKVKLFSLSKLRGYSNQAILSSLDSCLVSKHKTKGHKSNEEGEEEFTHEDTLRQGAKRNRSGIGHQRLETGHFGVLNSVPGNQMAKCEPTYRKLKIRLSSTGPIGIKLVERKPQYHASFKVDDKIELLCQDSGIRGCWFRCKILQVSQERLKVQYNDVQELDEAGNLEEWVPTSRVAATDKLGMRCSGRLTIRPWPPEDSSDCPFKVGAAVDAWWSDGWWEGVLSGVNISGSDSLQVYVPGENKILILPRENIRTSRDWVGNRWVDIKAKPDIHCYISSIVSPGKKLPMCSTLAEESECGGSASVDHKVVTTSEPEAIEEGKPQAPGLAMYTDLENEGVNLRKRACTNDDDKTGRSFYSGGNDRATNEAKTSLVECEVVAAV